MPEQKQKTPINRTLWRQLVGTSILIHEDYPLSAEGLKSVADRLEKDHQHLEWIYQRMKNVHGEDENVDYMLKFREVIDSLKNPT